MPDIEKAAFGGRDPITGAEWSTLSTPSMGQQAVEEFLEAQGWDQRAAGVVGLKLSPDNSKIMAARLALVGNWQDEPMHMQAKKLWTDAPENLSLEVTLNNLAAFRFADGDMWSGFVAGDSVRHKFVETTADGPKEPTDEELATWGVGEFSLKAVCSLARTSSARWGIWLSTTVLIFPGSEDELIRTLPEAVDPAWPGLRLVDGEIALLPAAGRGKRPLGGKAWGCPLAPAIQPGSPWEETPGTLTAAEVSEAIGDLLNIGCLPDTSVGAESLKKKWEKLIRNPRDMRRRKPDRTWPASAAAAAAAAAAKKGRRGKKSIFGKGGEIGPLA